MALEHLLEEIETERRINYVYDEFLENVKNEFLSPYDAQNIFKNILRVLSNTKPERNIELCKSIIQTRAYSGLCGKSEAIEFLLKNDSKNALSAFEKFISGDSDDEYLHLYCGNLIKEDIDFIDLIIVENYMQYVAQTEPSLFVSRFNEGIRARPKLKTSFAASLKYLIPVDHKKAMNLFKKIIRSYHDQIGPSELIPLFLETDYNSTISEFDKILNGKNQVAKAHIINNFDLVAKKNIEKALDYIEKSFEMETGFYFGRDEMKEFGKAFLTHPNRFLEIYRKFQKKSGNDFIYEISLEELSKARPDIYLELYKEFGLHNHSEETARFLRNILPEKSSEFISLCEFGLKQGSEEHRVGIASNLELIIEFDPDKYAQLYHIALDDSSKSVRDAATSGLPALIENNFELFISLFKEGLHNKKDDVRVAVAKNLAYIAVMRPQEFIALYEFTKDNVNYFIKEIIEDLSQKLCEFPVAFIEANRKITSCSIKPNSEDLSSIFRPDVLEQNFVERLYEFAAESLKLELKPSFIDLYETAAINKKEPFLYFRMKDYREKLIDPSIIIRRIEENDPKSLMMGALIKAQEYYESVKESLKPSEELGINTSRTLLILSILYSDLQKKGIHYTEIIEPKIDNIYSIYESKVKNLKKSEEINDNISRISRKDFSSEDDIFHPGYQFLKSFLESKYVHVESDTSKPLRKEDDIRKELMRLISRKDIDYKHLSEILAGGLAKNLDEIVELSEIKVPHFTPLKRIGNGAIKKAYLARQEITQDEAVILEIDPNSKGFLHYKNIHPHLSEEDLKRRMYEEEFSMSKIFSRLDDYNYIALIQFPIKGFVGNEEKFFLPTKRYEKTLETAIINGEVTLEKAIKYFYQMCYGLTNCHNAGIIHKDLKPDNIGITTRDSILISDFGCVSMFSKDAQSRYQCPLELRPPELAYDESYWQDKEIWQSDLFTPEANIWSTGAIMYRMFTGKYLFERPSKRAEIGSKAYHQQNLEVYEKIRNFDSHRDEIIARLKSDNPEVSYLISQCLVTDPNERKGAFERIINFMHHNENLSCIINPIIQNP